MCNPVFVVEFKKNLETDFTKDNFCESIAIGRIHHNCPLLLISLIEKNSKIKEVEGRKKKEKR